MYTMGNGLKTLAELAELPFFSIGTAKMLLSNETYLRILLSRYVKGNKVIRLKNGFYTTRSYVDNTMKKGIFTSYLESLATSLYPNSYLSMEYVLQKHNLLTESVRNFTLVSRKKTAAFLNPLGKFIYHNIKKDLFLGFKLAERDGFNVYEASAAKALFDYLYFRKPFLVNRDAIKELRINVDALEKSDLREFDKYVMLDASKKMKLISEILFKI